MNSSSDWTSVDLSLPRSSLSQTRQWARHDPRASLRVLVIDDEPLVGKAVAQLLRHDLVEVYQRPGEALQRARQQAFDLVLCDLQMPSMSGVEVHERLSSMRPELTHGFVLMTGALIGPFIQHFVRSRRVGMLQKPFTSQDVERCVREMAPHSSLSR
jgi:CheY-like chemotaxis protein